MCFILYLREIYSSLDVDIVYPFEDDLREVFDLFGFKKEGRYFIQDELRIVIEIPSSTLSGDENRVETVEFENGLYCKIIGIEDLLIDRVNACKYGNSKIDCEMAQLLSLKYGDQIDWNYMIKKAEEPQNDIAKEIEQLRKKSNEEKS